MTDKRREFFEARNGMRVLTALVDMRNYISHDVDPGKCAACPRWDELQAAVMELIQTLEGTQKLVRESAEREYQLSTQLRSERARRERAEKFLQKAEEE